MAVTHHQRIVNKIVKKAKVSFSPDKAKNMLTVQVLAKHMGIPKTSMPVLRDLLNKANLGVPKGDLPVKAKPKFRNKTHIGTFIKEAYNPIPVSSLKKLIEDLHTKAKVPINSTYNLTQLFIQAELRGIITLERIIVKDHNGKTIMVNDHKKTPTAMRVVCITPENLEKFAEDYNLKLAKMK